MQVLHARNVHQALPMGLDLLGSVGIRRDSRNGPVLQAPTPVTTVYHRPDERVVFHSERDANPFFHFYESLWMLAGRNDVKPLTRYVKRMADFSDDGETFNAAYGYRWRHQMIATVMGFFDADQLPGICERLKANPDTRQEVLQIWDWVRDLGTKTKDHACNIAATFQANAIDRSLLDMVVFNRSNDMILGAYGANAVHFSMLHEYVARRAGFGIGTYSQISVNYHMYLDAMHEKCSKLGMYADPYQYGGIVPHPIAGPNTNWAQWDEDCQAFITVDGRASSLSFKTPFFNDVAWPIVVAHDHYKDGNMARAFKALESCRADDWRRACVEWIARRSS